jgi:hypothetical protein
LRYVVRDPADAIKIRKKRQDLIFPYENFGAFVWLDARTVRSATPFLITPSMVVG